MKRIATPARAIDLFGPGKDGFKNGDLANGIQPTNLEADWCNHMQEELATAVEASGQALDPNSRTQLLKALRRMTGGYVRTVTAGHTVLTADDAGLVLVDATAGAVTIALPLANVLKALPFIFRRLDATGNSVTISVAGVGADVIDAGDTSFVLDNNDMHRLVSDGATSWHSADGITQAKGDVRYILASSVDETGKLASFMRSTAPAGYIKANGLTIGSPTSGATNRANADTWPLFSMFWAEFDNTLLHVQDSTGAPTTRGASAAADWTDNKRLPVFDRRGKFGRGWDDGRGLDAGRGLGTDQAYETASHGHTGSADAVAGHTHGINDLGHSHIANIPNEFAIGTFATSGGTSSDGTNGTGNNPYTSSSTTGISMASSGAHSHTLTIGATGGSETRPTNISELVCIKL